MEEKLCYMEDVMGGYVCYAKDKDYWINEYHHKATLCCEGTKEDIEKYLSHKIVYIQQVSK